MTAMQALGVRAKEAGFTLAAAGSGLKSEALHEIARQITARSDEILAANHADVCAARENGTAPAMLDRLALDSGRIAQISAGVCAVAALNDPIGEVIGGRSCPNGLRIVKTRVPLGVAGIIFEARPNVTVDAAAICLKSGNACLLRGGREAIRSNTTLAGIMREAIEKAGLPADCILLVEDTSRESANEMMRLSGYLDVLIPRGGAGLIQAVVQNAIVPVIETGTGNCHIYVDYNADIQMASNIIYNAKTQRPSVCNAAETLLVHRDIAQTFLPETAKELAQKNVRLLGCARTRAILPEAEPVTEEDYATEFLDYVLAVRVVDDVDVAIAHIARYSTRHSECIVTRDYANSQRFLQRVDAAAVYVNASTRFTDGEVFGLGAEIGISTQKLHARGPMGLTEMTTSKYLIYGDGQTR